MADDRRSTGTEVVYACLRVVASWVYMQHGLQKYGLLGGFGPNGGSVHFPSLMGWAGLIEITCGVLVLLGLFTRVAAFIASGEMALPISWRTRRTAAHCSRSTITAKCRRCWRSSFCTSPS